MEPTKHMLDACDSYAFINNYNAKQSDFHQTIALIGH